MGSGSRAAGDGRSPFRADINGLRAVAVAAVLLFHFQVPGFAAGFIGVDLFFVLSGFLLTRIVASALLDGRFTFAAFYAARARRIVPALGAMLLALLLLGYVFLDPIAYLKLGRYSAAAALFASNLVFASETGYLAPAAQFHSLLHTWSLSVEAQFYLLYPAYLVLMNRIGALRRFPVATLLVPAIGSLAVSDIAAFLGGRYLSVSFFVLPGRVWEMLAGGLVWAVGSDDRWRFRLGGAAPALVEAAGLAMITASLVLFTDATPWPSSAGLLPVGGVVAIILANRGQRSFLRPRPFQALGTISYSVYLWHWPVAVAARYFGWDPGPAGVAAGLSASVALGALSYALVEKPARSLFVPGRPSRTGLAWSALTAAAVLSGGAVWQLDGLPGRSRGDVALVRDAVGATREADFPSSCSGTQRLQLLPCWIGTPADGAPAVFGDSHAQMLYPRIADRARSAVFVANPGCSPFPNVRQSDRPDCERWRDRALAFLSTDAVGTVIYAANWPGYVSLDGRSGTNCLVEEAGCIPLATPEAISDAVRGLEREIASLQAAGKRVVLVLPIPTRDVDVAKTVARAGFDGRAPAWHEPDVRRTDVLRTLLGRLASRGVTVVDPRPIFCDGSGRCPATDELGRSLYRDDIHLRPRVVASRFDLLDRFLLR